MSDYGFDPLDLDPAPMMAAGLPVFLVGETMARNIMTQSGDEPPQWRVVIALNGKWNHGAEDRQVVMFSAENAVAVATSLIGAALACGRDEAVLLELAKLMEALEP